MSFELIIDNWMLQDIRSMFQEGLSEEDDHEIVIHESRDQHLLSEVPLAAIQIEALLNLLVSIVLRDKLIVDSAWVHAWDDENIPPAFSMLKDLAIVKSIPFRSYGESLWVPRRAIVKELCVTESLRQIQEENEQSWSRTGKAVDNRMSSILWGGAGYLARSQLYEAPYLGHPLRERIIEQSSLVNYSYIDATRQTLNWVQEGRTKLLQNASLNKQSAYATFNLPPVAVEVIEESNSVEQLIFNAIQLRDKYSRLRQWLKEYQDVLDNEDIQAMIKKKKFLDSVARNIETLASSEDKGNTKITLGVTWLVIKLSKSINVESLKNRFGVRGMLNRLMFQRRGRSSLEKLLTFFEPTDSLHRRKIMERLMEKYSSA